MKRSNYHDNSILICSPSCVNDYDITQKEKATNRMNGAYLKFIGHYCDTFTLGCVFTVLPYRGGLWDGREAIKLV